MIHATITAPSAAPPLPRTAIDWAVIYRNCPMRSAAISGRAANTSPTQRADGGVQLRIQREVLLSKIAHALSLRQSKRASLIEAELRALNHEILKQGPREC